MLDMLEPRQILASLYSVEAVVVGVTIVHFSVPDSKRNTRQSPTTKAFPFLSSVWVIVSCDQAWCVLLWRSLTLGYYGETRAVDRLSVKSRALQSAKMRFIC
jgi:hypothetical protein